MVYLENYITTLYKAGLGDDRRTAALWFHNLQPYTQGYLKQKLPNLRRATGGTSTVVSNDPT